MATNLRRKAESLLSRTGDMALKRRAKMLLEELNPIDSDVILDCGCGDGFYLYLISELSGCRLFGLDPDHRALKSARNNLHGRDVSLVEGSVYHLPFDECFFDKVILSEVLEHLEDDLGALRQIERVLKPGGILVITVPNRNYPFLWDPVNKFLERLVGKHIREGFWAGIWNQHLRLYEKREVEKLVRDAGFELMKSTALTHYCLPFNHYILNVGARLLAGKRLPPKVAASISKFSAQNGEARGITGIIFEVINRLDRRNNGLKGNKTTVSIFVKARKRNRAGLR